MRWASIPSLSAYEASSDGLVRRRVTIKPMPHGGVRSYGGTPRFGCWEATSGRYILMYKGKTYRVARLVCEAFNGPAPFDGAVVMHVDEDARNNRATNLRWGTQRENLNFPRFRRKRSELSKALWLNSRDIMLAR